MYLIRSFIIICGFFFVLINCADDAELTKILNLVEGNSSEFVKKPVKSEESDDSDEDYNDYSDETESASQSRNRNMNFGRRVGIFYAWGRWEKWSKCTTSCVQIRRRSCIKNVRNSTESQPIETLFYPLTEGTQKGCVGIMRKYRLCKDEKCKSNERLRDEQCEDFNKIPYKGRFYNWRGYEKEHNECELFCKAVDSDIFVSMNQSVTDGTPCRKPAVYYTHAYRRRAVCVEGICKAVHSSGAIRPATTNDSRLKCGSVLCRKVSELFSTPKLSYGYHYVATIPAGAMNVSIKQMAKKDNLLALKTTDDVFIINGNNRPSESATFEYKDDFYEYNSELETITAKGPLNRAVVLLLFVRGLNSGIKYDYTIPVPSAPITEVDDTPTQWNEHGQPLDAVDDNTIDTSSASQIARPRERRRRKFVWKLLGFGQCNRSCGPGVQQPIFRCIRESMTRYYSTKRCADLEKPTFSEDIYHCNRGLCPAYWRAGHYSECRCNETNGDASEGVRVRHAQCVQEQINGSVVEVEATLCEEEKPELMATCSCPRQVRRNIYTHASEEPAAMYARLVGAPSTVRNIHLNNTMPVRRQLRDDRVDKTGVWLMSEWNRECAAECSSSSSGYEHRSIYCDRTAPYTDLCDLRYTPEQKRPCVGATNRSRDCRRGVWFASEWSHCTGDCFKMQRARVVLCLLDGVVVHEEECEAAKRPLPVTNCTHEEVNYCGPKWHYSEWSECSRSCGEGIQRRYIKCLEYDWSQNALAESTKCKYQEREPAYGTCNVQKCEELDGTRDVPPNDLATPAEDCRDEFANCKRINEQRLCKLQFYKTYCCLTCRSYY